MGRFGIWIFLGQGAVLLVPVYQWGGWRPILGTIVLLLVLSAGLRSSIEVTEDRVTIWRTWFGIPFWRIQGAKIDSVYFDGDWGLDDDANGIVIKIGEKEYCFGSKKTMHFLERSLYPLSVDAKRYSKSGDDLSRDRQLTELSQASLPAEIARE
jgi:hypothetical protein